MALEFHQKSHHGAGKANSLFSRISTSDFEEALRDYRALKTDEAKAGFVDRLVNLCSGQLERTWPLLYEMLAIVRSQQVWKEPRWLEVQQAFASFEDYFVKVVGKPFSTWHDLERTHQFATTAMPELLDMPLTEANERRKKQTVEEALAAGAEAAGQHGGRREGAGRPTSEEREAVAGGEGLEPTAENQGYKEEDCNLDSASSGERGNRSSYRVQRLRRDHPAVAARLEAGEFKSVAAAERAAKGLEPDPPRKVPSPLDVLRRAWNRASGAERAAFLAEISHKD